MSEKARADAERIAKRLLVGATPQEQQALVTALLSGGVSSIFEMLDQDTGRDPEPVLRDVPAQVSGYRVRLDLVGAKPPVWRRLELPGDLTLPRVHDVVQAAMGWTDSHLHRFRTGRDHRAPYFLTTFDVEEEGEVGVPEDDVRLDQLVAEVGDELWYEYDFGDGWEHRLVVEAVHAGAPGTVACTAGRMACPPEDCGGLGGYEQLADWVRSDYDDAHLPDGFEDASHGRAWLPSGWHPDHLDLDEIGAALASASAEPAPVTGELAGLSDELERRGVRLLREVLGRPASHGPTDVTEDDAARLTEPYRVLLDVVGDGVTLTGAGYLPPGVVEEVAVRSGVTGWWIGKANREDLTPPVASIRDSARALGLVTVRKGRLTPTAAALRCGADPVALWRHVVSRLPLGTKDLDRHAGWLALAVAGSGEPNELWDAKVGRLLLALGWRSGRDDFRAPSGGSPTLSVLRQLSGEARHGRRVSGSDPAVAATVRAAIRRG